MEEACRFISQHLFSFDASDKYQSLKDQIVNGLETNQRLEGLEQLQHYLKRYSYQPTKELLCAKVFPVIKGKKHEVYTCTDCAEEDNSIFCVQCFDISMHKDHNYSIQFVKSGICDCGDKCKWNEETFCKKHAYDLHQKEDIPQWADQYKKLTAYFIKMLCWIYQSALRYQSDSFLNDSSCENNSMYLTEKIKNIVDQLGSFIIQQLILVNKNRTTISQLSRQVLNQEALYSVNFPFSCKWQPQQQERVPLMKMLLSFTQLPRTSSKCVELLMLLIFRSDQTHEQLTVEYISRYTNSGNFARSSYRQFSPQLLSNSLMIRNIEGPLFIIREMVDYNYCDQYNLISKVEQAYQYVDRYLSDLSYLINLREECAIFYWDHFCQNRGFMEIANFFNTFNNKQALDVVNQKYYKMEQRFLMKYYIAIINKHLSKNSLLLLIFQLFQKIQGEDDKMANDYFFTYQRMWALSVYLYLLRQGSHKNFNRIDDCQMIQLCRCLKIQDTKQSLQTFQSILQSLLKRLFKYFIKIDVFLCKVQKDSNVKDTYFYSYNLLSSIDSIFFKIILKLANYIQKKQPKELEQEVVSYKLVKKEINSQLSKLDQEIKIIPKNNRDYDSMLSSKLYQLTYFISRILECIFSDLPDLVLSCKFQDIHSRHLYQKAYYNYYLILLKTNKKSSNITIQNYRNLAKYFLFQETAVIEKIIDKFKSSETTLQNIDCSGKRINFSFVHSLKLKANNQEVQQLIQTSQLNSEPFIIKPKEGQLFEDTDSHKMLTYWLNYIIESDSKYFRESSETQSQSQQDHPSSPINQMVKTLWTIERFSSRDNSFHQYFRESNFSNTIYIDHVEKYLRKAISIQSEDQSSQKSEDESLWSQTHRKYCEEQQRLSANQQQSSICMQESISSRIDQQEYSPFDNIVIEVKPPVCILCKQEATTKAQLFQLCDLSQEKLPPFYDLYPNQSNLYFSSCSHFCHKTCISQCQENICPQCDKKYNYLLLIEQDLNLTNFNDIIGRQIEQSFGDIKKYVLSLGPCVEVRLYNSLLMFLLLLISVPDRQLLLRTNMLTYRNIFHVLKKYLSMKQQTYLILFKQKVKKDRLKGNVNSYYQNFINNVSQLLTTKLLNKTKDTKALQIKNKQLILQFFDNMNKHQLAFSNLDKRQAQGIFSLLPLEVNLKELQQSKKGFCKCQEFQNVFYVCLLHDNEVRFCRECYLDKMKQHIYQCHENDAIAVRTDTGEIYYFKNESEMKQLKLQSIYTNKLMQGFVPGKQKNKKLYNLNQTIYRQIATKYISQMFNHLL